MYIYSISEPWDKHIFPDYPELVASLFLLLILVTPSTAWQSCVLVVHITLCVSVVLSIGIC